MKLVEFTLRATNKKVSFNPSLVCTVEADNDGTNIYCSGDGNECITVMESYTEVVDKFSSY